MFRALLLQALRSCLLLLLGIGRLAAAWSVTSGQCKLDADGCISSTNHPSDYPRTDSCNIQVSETNIWPIEVVAWDVLLFDELWVNGRSYDGISISVQSPDGVVPRGTIRWRADSSWSISSGKGWKICLPQPQEVSSTSTTSTTSTISTTSVSSTSTTSTTSAISTTSTWSRTFTSTASTIATSRPKLQVVEKSPVEIGPAASVQQEAAAAVQSEDKRQQDAVASVLQELDLEELEEVGGIVTVDEGSRVTVAVISPRANASSFRFRAASSGQDFTPDVDIPLSLVAVATEPLLLAVNVMNQGGADKLQMADKQPPSTRPLVLSMFSLEGMPLAAASLPEPILLTLAPDASNDTTCVFWNETLQRWSAEGVTRVQGRGRELVCETTHLSIFAGIEGFLTEVALTFQCNNALRFFSREAAASVGTGDWAMQVPSIIFFAILGLLLSGVILAFCLDYRSWQRHCATHELQDELHRGVIAKKKKTDSASGGVVFIYEEVAWKQLLLLNKRHWSLFLDPDNLVLPHLSGTIQKAQAVHLSITPKSMAAVIGLATQTGSPRKSHVDKLSPGDFHKSAAVAEEVRSGRDLVKLHNQAADKFIAPGGKGFLYRWAVLAAAFHPWCLLISFCYGISHAARAVLRASHLLASAAVSVVFYQLTDAVKKECVEELSRTDARYWVRKLVVGIVSAVLSSGLMVVLLLIRTSRSDSGESRLSLRLALLQLILFWLGLVLYICLCVYAVLAFLANVSDKDTSDWVQTWLYSLLFTLVLKPIFRGLFVATVFSCALRFWPGLAGKVKEKRQLPLPLGSLTDPPDPVLPAAVLKPVDRIHAVQQDRQSLHVVRASFESDKDDSTVAEVLEPDLQDGSWREATVYCGNLRCGQPREKGGEA